MDSDKSSRYLAKPLTDILFLENLLFNSIMNDLEVVANIIQVIVLENSAG